MSILRGKPGASGAWAAVLLSVAGCVENRAPASPIRQDVATLDGYVAEVDGKPLPSGSTNELQPGCHIIGTPEEWGGSDTSMSMTVKTGKVLFAIPMRAGHRYSVYTNTTSLGSGEVTVTVAANETDASGAETATFKPAENQNDVTERERLVPEVLGEQLEELQHVPFEQLRPSAQEPVASHGQPCAPTTQKVPGPLPLPLPVLLPLPDVGEPVVLPEQALHASTTPIKPTLGDDHMLEALSET